MFTLEEAKGHGLKDDQGQREKGLCSSVWLAPSPPPYSQNLVKALAPSLEGCYKPRLELTWQG